MTYKDDKTYELVTFWLIAAHALVSFIMILCNFKMPSYTKSQKQAPTKKSKKSKNLMEEASNIVELYVSKICSLLKSNEIVWVISFSICVTVCVLLGLCIWGEKELELETTTEENK